MKIFKPEDFGYIDGNRDFDTTDCIDASNIANKIFADWLSSQPTVTFHGDGSYTCVDDEGCEVELGGSGYFVSLEK